MSRWINRTDSSTAWYAFAVTPSDVADLSYFARALYVGGAGDVALICEENDSSVTFVGVPAGTILPVRAKKVLSTGTTATSLVGLV